MGHSLFCQKGGVALLFQLIIFPLLQRGDDAVDLIIFICGLFCRTGDDERGSGFINQNTIHLIDNSVVQIPLDIIFKSKFHIVPEVIKPEFIIGSISDVTVIGILSFLVV